MKVRPIIAWYDFWIGCFYDRMKRRIYVFPLPCIGVVIQLNPTETELVNPDGPAAVARIEKLEAAVEQAAAWFEEYRDQHLDKANEADEVEKRSWLDKAFRNGDRASILRQALQSGEARGV